MARESKIDWMETLEKRVRAAADEIRRLRAENARLGERIESLTTELDAARAVAAAGTPPVAVEAAPDGAWEREREEVRQRVERLVKQLEGLIQEAEVADE